MAAGYPTFTTLDNSIVIAARLQKPDYTDNDFTNATAMLKVRDQNQVFYSRVMLWNSVSIQWEYPVRAGEFPAGRYWAMILVTWPTIGMVYSTESIFDVEAPD